MRLQELSVNYRKGSCVLLGIVLYELWTHQHIGLVAKQWSVEKGSFNG